MTTQSTGRTLLLIAIVAIVALIGYGIMYGPDGRTDSQKMSDAIKELPNGVDNSARQLEDRTPADKLVDAVEDVGNDLKKATNQQ